MMTTLQEQALQAIRSYRVARSHTFTQGERLQASQMLILVTRAPSASAARECVQRIQGQAQGHPHAHRTQAAILALKFLAEDRSV